MFVSTWRHPTGTCVTSACVRALVGVNTHAQGHTDVICDLCWAPPASSHSPDTPRIGVEADENLLLPESQIHRLFTVSKDHTMRVWSVNRVRFQQLDFCRIDT
jgi:hypothetical protein